MILKMKVQQVGLMLTCIPLLLLSSLVMADQDQHMLIDIDSDRVEIDQLDISHLTPGDSETIYTEDGRTVDVLRTEHGMEIFVDGEPLFSPDSMHLHHSEDSVHDGHRIVIEVECDSEVAEECEDHYLLNEEDWAVEGAHEAHRVMIIKKDRGK